MNIFKYEIPRNMVWLGSTTLLTVSTSDNTIKACLDKVIDCINLLQSSNENLPAQSRLPMQNTRSYKISIIAPTCFYYQAPLFRELAATDQIDLTVYFCSYEGVSGDDIIVAYGANQDWGVERDLLSGYQSKFLRNHSPKGSYLKSLVGLVNLGIWNELKRNRPDAVIVMSWMNPTWWLTFLACLKFKIPMLFMTDANIITEHLKNPFKAWLKRILVGKLLFSITTGFLCAGTANRKLYTHYGVPDHKLVSFAYSWGYSYLTEQAVTLVKRKAELRKKYGIPEDAFVVLYCGRFSAEKGSMELLDAYNKINHAKKALVLVGDGNLKSQMQNFADANSIESIYFMGFQTRKNLPEFYALADVFVLPSRMDTWGMVVNEALCFSLPVVVSDHVGSGVDLVSDNENGHVFPAGDSTALADRITKLIELPNDKRIKMGEKSSELIKNWSTRDIAAPLKNFLDGIYEVRSKF